MAVDGLTPEEAKTLAALLAKLQVSASPGAPLPPETKVESLPQDAAPLAAIPANESPPRQRRRGLYQLTDLTVQRLKPGAKKVRHTDGGGLCLEVTPAGGKLWVFRFRFEGRWQTLSLGRYPCVSLAEAREKHFTARKELQAGRNPSAVKKAGKVEGRARAAAEARAETIEALTFTKVAESYLDSREKSGAKRVHENARRLQNHILPALGRIPIKEITTGQILEALLAVKNRGLEEMAKRCRTYISQIYQHAIVRGWVDRDPAKDLERLPELQRTTPPEHHRAVKNPAELARLLVDLESIKPTIVGAALWMAPYVFIRSSELAGARWDEIDWQESLWRIPKERMKAKRPHFVPLARQVREHLEALHKLTGHGPVVFPGHKSGQGSINAASLLMALNRLGYGRGAVISHSHHGFKSVASTFLREQGFNRDWVEAQLAHGKRDKIEAAYNHAEYVPQRRKMMQAWADYLDELRAGR